MKVGDKVEVRLLGEYFCSQGIIKHISYGRKLMDEGAELDVRVVFPDDNEVVFEEKDLKLVESREMRQFDTGATRNADTQKLDFEGFLSPAVLERYAQYLHKHRKQADGKIRDSDNWQAGIPKDVYIKSAFRHFIDVWKQHRGLQGQDTLQDSLCAVMFNIMGYLFEDLR